ncbi:MAG: endonuclease III domain-containing protein [Planctomycetota bacterium]|nr:endonuclease III domain-containing protein [Planctomycetota bacterium]
MSTATTLTAMYEAMRARFGDRHWWPADRAAPPDRKALEICVGAILTQNTAWTNVEKAIANLRAAGALDVGALAALPAPALAELIRPAGYFNVKAKRLKNFIARVHDYRGGDILAFLGRSVDTLREDLLAVSGIGAETADSIILYAAGKLSFVVDAYTCRILRRHKLIGPDDDYTSVQELLAGSLPKDVALWNDYHAQIVETGKHYCRPTARCPGCPLEGFPHDPQADKEP